MKAYSKFAYRVRGYVNCSFFWMKHLYAYMDYNAQTRKLRPQQLMYKMDIIAGQQIVQNRPNKTGETFKSITIAR